MRGALDIARSQNDRQLEALAVAGLAKNSMYQGQDARAIEGFEIALTIFEELCASFYVATVRGELGTCFLPQNKVAKALQLLEESAAALLANGSMSNHQVSLADIGGVYLAQGRYLEAISYYQQALSIARDLGDEVSVSKWLRNLVDSCTRLGNAALAKEFEKEAELICNGLATKRKRGADIAASLE